MIGTQQQLDLAPEPDRAALGRARDRAEVGIQRAADATERETPGWCELACEKLRQFAVGHEGLFTIETARGAFEHTIDTPHDLRSWGVVTRMATRRAFIEQVAGTYIPAASSNGSPKAAYRRGPKA
jgi:hypothetical protein